MLMRHHMVWVTASEADKPLLGEIENQTDRGAALIATAYLDERLLAAIKVRIIRDESLENKLFRGSGPLAAFSVRIDIGFMLGIFDAKVHKMLHTVREIRNEFAHKPEPRNFNSQRIKDLCKNIAIVMCFNGGMTLGGAAGARLRCRYWRPGLTPCGRIWIWEWPDLAQSVR
jgi:hypothetical protein